MSGLEGIGEWDGYEPKTRVITPRPFVYALNDFLVKFYTMFEKGAEPYESFEIGCARDAVYEKLRTGKARKHCGMGVAILSEGVLNIGMWGNNDPNGTPPDYPSLIHPYVFQFPEERVPDTEKEFVKVDLNDVGSHCRWELELLGRYEADCWDRYMRSSRQSSDKTTWSDNAITCEI